MSERKTRRVDSCIELDQDETSFVLEPAKIEVGSGYAVSVRYDEDEKPIVDFKTYGKVDLRKLRREIEHVFPHARINQLNPNQSVTIVKSNKKRRKRK